VGRGHPRAADHPRSGRKAQLVLPPRRRGIRLLFRPSASGAGISASLLPKGIEGGSIASLLAGDGQGKVQRPREELVFHFPHYQSEDEPQSSILLGNLKLMWFYEDRSAELFDLSNDISESNDLSSQMPSETAQLRDRLQKYLAVVGAQIPGTQSAVRSEPCPSFRIAM